MKNILSLVLFLFLVSMLHAQYKVQFIVKEKTAIHHDSIYITGTFNNWDSTSNRNYLMHPHGENEKSIVLNLKAGVMRYKFIRGNWFNVEKQNYGDEVPDRIITISKDTTLMDSVERWRDQMFVDKWYALAKENADTNRVKILASIATAYAYQEYYNADSTLYYTQSALQLQQKIMASANNKLWAQTGYSIQLYCARDKTVNDLA